MVGELKLPKYDDLLMPTLLALRALGGSGTIEEIDDWIVNKLGFTQDEMDAVYPKSGASVIPDRCSWARSYLKIAKLIDSGGRGIWLLKDAGRTAADGSDPALRKAVALAYRERAKTYRAKTKEILEANFDESDDWSDDLISVLRAIKPDQFERLAQRLLREAGFTKVEVTGKSGDGGVDGIGVLRLNLVSFQVFFQCKRYKGTVGSGEVRDFRGAMAGRADKGLIITTGHFSADAKREATRDGAPAIDLVDGDDLCLLLKQYSIGVSTQQVEEVQIDPAFFNDI